MELKVAFGQALKRHRSEKGLTQEDFSGVSSRTYLSTMERGIKCPTLEKVVDLASVIGIHPATLMIESFLRMDPGTGFEKLIAQIAAELAQDKASGL